MSTDLSQQLAEEQWIRAYFLGDLPEVEEERIQERLFTDPDFFESLLLVEGELVDDYALDLISDREREKLESAFLNPHQYRRVEFVRTLHRYISNNKSVAAVLPKSGFTRLRPKFAKSSLGQNVKSAAAKNRVSVGIEKERKVRERILGEAAAKRKLLQCLMANDWLGLELLLQLKSVSHVTQTDLADLVERDEPSLTAALPLLIDCGLVEEAAGRYTCSSSGAEILERIKEVTGHE